MTRKEQASDSAWKNWIEQGKSHNVWAAEVCEYPSGNTGKYYDDAKLKQDLRRHETREKNAASS